jgi:hypothetical protein
MTNQWIERAASEVKLDLSRLKGEAAGTDTRYTVSLAGPIGEPWLDAYRTLQQAEPAAHRRFEFDVPRATVRFSCRTVDGTGVVFDLLEQLETIVDRVNQVVAVRRAAGPRISLVNSALRAR